jgi:hypothetical protein
MKAMSYINLFIRNPSAHPVSVVFDLFTYYNEHLWLIVKILCIEMVLEKCGINLRLKLDAK